METREREREGGAMTMTMTMRKAKALLRKHHGISGINVSPCNSMCTQYAVYANGLDGVGQVDQRDAYKPFDGKRFCDSKAMLAATRWLAVKFNLVADGDDVVEW